MIETERLILRVPEPADHPALRGWWGDPTVMANLGPVMDAAGADAAIARHDSYRPEGLGFWIVERKADGQAIGFCGLKRCNPGSPVAGQLEIGWMFGPESWGHGYAGEAAKAALDWAWDHVAEDRVIAITARVNGKSQRLMARIGMRAAPELDFEHPLFAEGDRLRSTVVYVADRPA